ncbi:MAG: amidohydrolase family protein [Phycisphaerae bacterium]
MIQFDLPQVIEQIMANNTQWVDKFCGFYRDRFVTEIESKNLVMGTTKRNDQRDDISIEYFAQVLTELEQKNCKFVGEIMLAHADKIRGDYNINFERYINPSAPILNSLLSYVDVPIMIHWEAYNIERDLANIKQMLDTHRTKTFIWVHCGFAHPPLIDDMLSQHSNLVATLSKLELIRTSESWLSSTHEDLGGYNVRHKDYMDKLNTGMLDSDGEIKSEWKTLLEKYPDRFMFATDSHKTYRQEKYDNIVSVWRNILGKLDEDLAKMIAHDNAMRIFDL